MTVAVLVLVLAQSCVAGDVVGVFVQLSVPGVRFVMNLSISCLVCSRWLRVLLVCVYRVYSKPMIIMIIFGALRLARGAGIFFPLLDSCCWP